VQARRLMGRLLDAEQKVEQAAQAAVLEAAR
jgi:hypothetical protein